MHLVVDAIAVRTGSVTVVLEHLLRGWSDSWPEDRITVLAGPGGPEFALPEGVDAHILSTRLPGPFGQAWLRSGAIRRVTRALGADLALAAVPASGLLGTACPRAMILYDLRHELRPHQFSRRSRIARRFSWGWSMRRADSIYCISDRTLSDLTRLHPRQADRGSTALLGADHVDSWPAVEESGPPYALAFGHFANKNADAVLTGWARFCQDVDSWSLRVVGMSPGERETAARRVAELGIESRVELMPWLDDDAFARCFRGAGLVIFPSDFEGFGLPAVEAMRLGIPLVVSHDPALSEITGGHAVAAAPADPVDLASAMSRALARTPQQLDAAARHTDAFTWAGTASTIRAGFSRTTREDQQS